MVEAKTKPEKSKFRRVSISNVEKLSDTECHVYCAIGNTIVEAKLSVNKVFRGVLGSVRSANNPIVVNLTGEENLKAEKFTHQYTIMKYIKSQVLKHMGAEFRELKPEADSFRTLNFSIRVIMDEGNHVAGALLASLSTFFFWLTTQQFMLEEKHDHDWIKSAPYPVVLWEPPATSQETDGKLFMDPTSKEESIGGSLWIYLISETGQSLFRSGGSVLPSGLKLYSGQHSGAKWREWLAKGKDAPLTLTL